MISISPGAVVEYSSVVVMIRFVGKHPCGHHASKHGAPHEYPTNAKPITLKVDGHAVRGAKAKLDHRRQAVHIVLRLVKT